MAINVKSPNQIIADMIRKFTLETPGTDVSEGSTAGTILEAAGLQDYQNQVAALKILESTNLQTLVGTDLDSKAEEMNLPNGRGGIGRIPALRSSGNVTISSDFKKLASAIYIGKPAPFAGSVKLFLQDAEGWPSTGSVYIGRGTNVEEGPIPYTSIEDNNSFYTVNLNTSTPLVNNHQYSESVILAQGGNRTIPAGTVVSSPATSGNPSINYTVDATFQLLDGESKISVPVTAVFSGEDGNVAAGAINTFQSIPFSGASVINSLPLSNGASAEGDEALRTRIKNYIATLARGTRTAIESALLGLNDAESGKTITSVNVVEPTESGDPAKAYIGDGSTFEPDEGGQGFEQFLVNSSGKEVLFRTADFPITPCTVNGTRSGPFSLADGQYIDVEIDGIIERFSVNQVEYTNLLSVSPFEIVRAFNGQETQSGVQNIGFRTSNRGQNFTVFDLTGTAETIRVLESDLQVILGLPTDEIRPIFLYQNNNLLSFKGTTATLQTDEYPWASLSASDLENVGMTIDGVTQYFTIADSDFTQFGATISSATLDQWVAVFKTKVAGVNVYQGAGRLFFATWQELSASGSVTVLENDINNVPAGWVGVNKMWSTNLPLSSTGSGVDYDLNRLTGQIQLRQNPPLDSNLTAASRNTRAEILSKVSPTGLFSIGPSDFGNAKIVVAADGTFETRNITITGSLSLTPSVVSPDQNLIRLDASDISLFSSVRLNDFLYLSPNSGVSNFMTDRLNSFYRVREKGLNTRSVAATFTNSSLDFAVFSGTETEVTVSTSGGHAAVVGKQITISSLVLDPVNATLNTAVSGLQTVSEVVDETTFKFLVTYTGALPAGPNTATVSIDADSYVTIETSDLQRDAFFGLFTDAEVTYSLLSSVVEVEIPRHSLTGGFIQVNSVSPALAAMFPGLTGIPGPKPIVTIVDENVIRVDLGAPAAGAVIPGPVTLSGQYTTTFASYDIIEGMVSAFKCEGATPQIIDFGTLPTQDVDTINETINSSAIGINAYKVSPQQTAIRSLSFNKDITKVAILATTGTSNALFDPATTAGIQQHAASKNSKSIASGGPKFTDIVRPTTPSAFYPNRGILDFEPTTTLIKNDFANPDIEADSSVLSYPIGLQEVGISGREYNHFKRVYNNNVSAPFAGFLRGDDSISSVAQSRQGANIDESSLGLRMSDLPFNFTDSLIIEMDLDEINKTTSIPMFKRALTEEVQPFGSGRGAQITFTLKDPDDEITAGNPRPFFEVNSPYRDFDLRDFNILFKPTLIHTNYQTLPFVGNPSDAFIVRSSQFGANHEARFSLNLPSNPNTSQIVVSHKSYEENSRIVQAVSVGLKSGSVIVGSEYTGIYSVTPSALTSPTGAEIVQVSVSALSLNLSGVFQIGNIIRLGGSLPYSGSFLIIDTPDADTVVFAAPGIRNASLPGPTEVYDGTTAAITSFEISPVTMQDVKDAVDAYFADNPVVSVDLSVTTNAAAEIKFPTYYSHGSSVVNNDLTDMTKSFDYHAKRSYFGALAHIHTYDVTNNRVIAVVQNEESPLPLASDVVDTGFPTNYSDQECMLIPANAKALERWTEFTAVSPFFIQGESNRVENETSLQLNTFNLGTEGAVRVTGVSANNASSIALASPFAFDASLKVRTDFATAQTLPRDTLVRVENTLRAPIYRPYRSTPTLDATTSIETPANTIETTNWFRRATEVFYSRPVPGIGRFEFRKTLSGLEGGETVEITKINPFIAKLEITAGSGLFSARVGDMLILRGDFSASDVSYTSIFNSDNQCVSSVLDIEDKYIGYPVVHVEAEGIIYVIGPNITPETVTARDTGFGGAVTFADNGFGQVRINGVTNAGEFSVGDIVSISGSSVASYNSRFRVITVNAGSDFIEVSASFDTVGSGTVTISRQTTEFMFVPALNAEKNIRTNYNPGAPKLANWKISPNEEFFYRVKTLGNGLVYLDMSFTSHADMQMTDMSVSSDDWVELSEAFSVSNRGRYRIIAHNGTDAIIFKNESAVDEVISSDETIENGKIGKTRWRIGPKGDDDISTSDKRPVRIWDGDSIFTQDLLSVRDPAAGTTQWFDASVIGDYSISKVGLTRDFDAFCEATIPGATSVARSVLLGSSFNSIGFTEGSPYVGHKWSLGYANNDADQSEGELFLAPQTMSYKISPAYTTQFISEHKLQFTSDTDIGIDGYRYYSGLIGEAHRVVDGVPSNTVEYPGVRAAGTSVEVLAPLIKSITMSLQLESRDGVSLNSIKSPVRSAITTYVNSLGVGADVVLSEVTRRIQNVPGVRSVVIVSTLPVADDGVVKVGTFEVPRISSADDILI